MPTGDRAGYGDRDDIEGRDGRVGEWRRYRYTGRRSSREQKGCCRLGGEDAHAPCSNLQ